MSNATKMYLSEALEKLLLEKPLNKITVSEICATCEVSRMTFYYHFKDMFDLVKWTFERRTKETLKAVEGDSSWQLGLHNLFELMYANKELILNVYDSVGHDRLHAMANDILRARAAEDYRRATEDLGLTEEYKTFVATFFSNAVIGTCFDWIGRGMDESEIDGIIARCCVALKSSVRATLLALEQAGEAV